MNKLEIKIKNSRNEIFKSFKEIQLFVDGTNFIEIIKKVELPFAEQERHPELLGNYQGLNLEFLKKDHFLGSDAFYGKEDDKTALLDCTCGSEGCWTLAVEITATDNSIKWSNFENIHRNGEIGQDNIWDYGKLFFEFEKDQYLREIEIFKITSVPI